ncbi:MAG TPA: hypothetical protein DIT43_01410 [Dehalococcoidia bacterium]|nr:hypothetical protein [Dehalococcoidia bacterium]
MRFLVDEDLPRAVDSVLKKYGHEAIDVRDVGFRGARDFEIANYAQSQKLCILSGDLGFCDVRHYPPRRYAGLVIIRIPKGATASFIVRLLESFLKRDELVSGLAGKLAIVEVGRVRFRER